MSDAPEYLAGMDVMARPDGTYLVSNYQDGAIGIYEVDPAGPEVRPFRDSDLPENISAEAILHKVIIVAESQPKAIPPGLIDAAVSNSWDQEGQDTAQSDTADSDQSEATERGMQSRDPEADRELVLSVTDFLKDELPDMDGVEVFSETHDATMGVAVDLDKREMGNALFEGAKSVINDVDGTTYHAGWMDGGCDGCGKEDGEGYYHFPDSVVRQL
jgi:hypothetical protein